MIAARIWVLGVVCLTAPAEVCAQPDGSLPEGDASTRPSVSGSTEPSESPGPEGEEARASFLQGTALAREGRWKEALEFFEASLKRHPHPVTHYNIGYVERALGRYTRARRAFKEALSSSQGGTLPEDIGRDARAYLEEVEKKIARVRVSVQAEDVLLSVDGRPLEIEAGSEDHRRLVAGIREAGPPERVPFRVFDLLVDPGEHVVALKRADGRAEAFERSARVASDNQWTLRPSLPEAAPSRVAKEPAPQPAPKAPASATRNTTWAVVSYGVAGIGLATGITFGALAMTSAADLDKRCSDRVCSPDARSEVAAYETRTTLSDIGFAVALGGAIAGTYFLVFAPKNAAPTTGRAAVGAWVAPSSAGLLGEF